MNEATLSGRFARWLDTRPGPVWPAAAFIAGLLLSRVFSPLNWVPALLVVVPFMIMAIDSAKTPKQAFGRGWWVGFGLYAAGINWIGVSFTQQDAVPAWTAPIAVTALAAGLAFYNGIVFWFVKRFGTTGAARILLFAAVWTIVEMVRAVALTGFPWHSIGSLWSDWGFMAQGAWWITLYGLSFITLIAAAAPILWLDGSSEGARIGWTVAGFSALAAVGFAGAVRLSANSTTYDNAMTLRIVQANIPQREKWVSWLIDDHFDQHLQLSRAKDTDGVARDVRLLIWPEAAVQRETFDRQGSILRWRLAQVLEPGALAITGGIRYEIDGDRVRYYNSLFAVAPDTSLYARYDKAHLVPFGEYLPFNDFLESIGLASLTGAVSQDHGPGPVTLHLPGVPPVSPLICYEAVFPGDAIDAGDRPEWLLNVTNDGWFGLTDGPYQHLALARFRAIEEGLPLVRAASTGISAVIDPLGRTVAKLGLNKKGVLDSSLPKPLAAPAIPTRQRLLLVAALMVLITGTAIYWGKTNIKNNVK